MTFATPQCVHNLPQTSNSQAIGKVIAAKYLQKKNSAAPQASGGAPPNNPLNNWWTTPPGSLFHTLIPSGRVRIRSRIFAARAHTWVFLRSQEQGDRLCTWVRR
jgi:hypothetical protein